MGVVPSSPARPVPPRGDRSPTWSPVLWLGVSAQVAEDGHPSWGVCCRRPWFSVVVSETAEETVWETGLLFLDVLIGQVAGGQWLLCSPRSHLRLQ